MSDKPENTNKDKESETKPESSDAASSSGNDEAKATSKQEDAKKEEPKAEAKQEEPKAEATKEEPKKAEPKAEAKKEEAKADAPKAAKKPAAKKPAKKPVKKKAPPKEPRNPERWQHVPIRGLKTEESDGYCQTRVAQLNHLKDVYADLSDDEEAKGFVKDIDTALERIENGTYFLCTACQREIPKDDIRRQNSPWLTTCSYFVRKKEWCER